MRRLLSLIILFAISVLTVSCNTIEGMGKDIKHGGKKIENTAQEHKADRREASSN